VTRHTERTAFSELVQRRRQALGMSQEEVSERVEMSQEWASMVERGRIKQPRISTLKKLAPVLGVSIEELVIAVGYATSRRGAESVVQEKMRDPVLEASFLALSELSPKRLAQVRELIAAMQYLDKKEYGNT
jgi:transcriptional regulator with XRE-family HTH domain